jgi:hypothetical protein
VYAKFEKPFDIECFFGFSTGISENLINADLIAVRRKSYEKQR